MMSMLSGISAFGGHIGAGSSYGAFSAPLGHISARLHAIGNQARVALEGGAFRPFFLVCAHVGLKTGEDGPTHADPQSLQLLQDNFPLGTMITLTPWDPQEIWFLVSAALANRPAIIAPFVTRPPESGGRSRRARSATAGFGQPGRLLFTKGVNGGKVPSSFRGSGVTNAFVTHALPLIERERIDLNVYANYVMRAVRSAAGSRARANFSRSASAGSDGHHRLHVGDDDPVGAFGLRPRPFASSVPARAFPWERLGRDGDERSGPGRRISQFEAIRAYVRGR